MVVKDEPRQVSKFNCPNKANHVSAWPSYDRVRCPYCRSNYETPVYVKAQEVMK